jgi:hypothetical protein
MGAAFSEYISTNDDVNSEDLDSSFSSLHLDAIYNSSYISSIIEKIPVYPGTEISMEDGKNGDSWDSLSWQLRNLFTTHKEDVMAEDFAVSCHIN